jgi:hypothetical protein
MMQASASEDRQMLEHLAASPTLRVLTNTEELERIAMRILPDTPSPVVNTDPSGAFQWQPHPDQVRGGAHATIAPRARTDRITLGYMPVCVARRGGILVHARGFGSV